MTFYEKVKNLCEAEGISITSLAVKLGYSGSAATTWKKSSGLPRAKTIKAIADYFDISIAELLEETDPLIDYENYETDDFNQPVFQTLLKKYNYNKTEAVKAYLKFEEAQKNGYYESTAAHTINDNHGVIGNTNAPVTINNSTESHLTEQELELLKIFNELTVLNKAKLLIYAEQLKEGGKNET